MLDEEIVELYWQRNEDAIQETMKKYGVWLFKIARNILGSSEDSEEAVNDTYYRAWCTMPDKRPDKLNMYLAKIVRELSIDIWRGRHRKKREGNEYALSLEEVADTVSGGDVTQETVDAHLLMEAINTYLRSISLEKRSVFIGRYFFLDPVKDIAAYEGLNEYKVKNLLHKTRKNLKTFLEKEGFLL